MGQSQSADEVPSRATPEHLSHELALRFATKCFTPLELSHLKDNFRTLADQNDGLKYWKEDTLCRFLCLPDALGAGPVIYQMATYLGAFPFPSLAPSILTLEALVKVVVIMTERYSRILKRGKKDRIKLLFRSLAVFDRRMSIAHEKEKSTMEDIVAEQKPDEMRQEADVGKGAHSHVAGYAIDAPVDDAEEDEDDDELALAALDSLDAIEVFNADQHFDRKIHHAQIPVDNFRRLLLLLLALAPLEFQDNTAKFGESLTEDRIEQITSEADSIIAAFEPERNGGGITYRIFTKVISSSMPYIFEPLNALFEHFLFSKNLDLSRRNGNSPLDVPTLMPPTPSPIVPSSVNEESLLTEPMLQHLATFMTTSPSPINIFHARTQFYPLYSTSSHGTSLTSLSRQLLSWQGATLLLATGSTDDPSFPSITFGSYIPYPWSKPLDLPSSSPHELPSLFILTPRHSLFPANPYHRPSGHSHTSSSAPYTHFSTKTGISVGCIIPPSSRTQIPQPAPGPVSLHIDTDLSSAVFTYTPDEGTGAFVPDCSLPQTSSGSNGSGHSRRLPPKLTIDISTLTFYGLSTPDLEREGEDELTRQKKALAWEEAEAERRRGVNFGGDKEGARALLEMAGIVGQNRSGGSMG